jgi:hypothetical protein
MLETSTPSLRPHHALLVLGIVAYGCGGPEDDPPLISAEARPLNGDVVFPDASCSGRTTLVQTIVRNAHAQLFASQMDDCLRNAIFSYTDSGYPEEVLSRMRAAIPTQVDCADLPPGVAAKAQANLSDERVTLDTGFLDTSTPQFMSQTVLHEVAHNKGYIHATEANDNGSLKYIDVEEYKYTVNEQLFQCSKSIAAGSANPNGVRRDALPFEATLAPTGQNGGGPFEIACPNGRRATGLQVRSGTMVDAVGLSCQPVGGGSILDTALTGGPGGTFTFNDCFDGEVLVGLHGRAGAVNEAVGPICSAAADVRAGLQRVFRDAQRGGTGGVPTDRLCPPFMAVRAIKGKSGSFVDRLEVECQQLDAIEVITERDLGRVGGTGGSPTREKCIGRSALVGLDYQTGARLDRLGGICALVVTTGLSDDTRPDRLTFLPAHGGTGGGVGQDTAFGSCGGFGAVMVGLKIRADSGLVAVAGRCARAAGWSNPSNTITPTDMPMRGGTSGGAITTVDCARGEFLVGWTIGAGTMVDSVQPICRNFN